MKVKTPNAEQKIMYLSGGNQQKAILGRWLSMPMKVLLLDEPTRGIDIGAKSEIYQIIHNLEFFKPANAGEPVATAALHPPGRG